YSMTYLGVYHIIALLCLPSNTNANPGFDEIQSFADEEHTRARRSIDNPSFASGQVSGDVIIGGLFSVHSAGGDKFRCGPLNEQVGIHRLEAMLYAIDLVNADHTLLPNISLGADIRDDCENINRGLEQSLNLLQGMLGNNNRNCPARDWIKERGPITAGVVGPSYSSLATQVASLLRLFKVPQISYAATSTELSDTHRFDYFMRTVPPDLFQALAIVDIIRAMNWSAVFAINSRGSYGEGGIQSFQKMARKANVCIVDVAQVDDKMNPVEYTEILERFTKESRTRVVVLFCNTEDIHSILASASRLNLTRYFMWLASDFWGSKNEPLFGVEDVANGAMTIELQTNQRELNKFYDYFKQLRPETNSRNPWFREYWEWHFKCKLENNSLSVFNRSCSDNQSGTHHLHYDGKVMFVVNAVLSFAHALHNLHSDICSGEPGMCYAMRQATRDSLISYLRNVTFNGTTGRIQFDSNGDTSGKYDVLQYRRDGEDDGRYVRVGSWIEGELKLNTSEITEWYVSDSNAIESHCGKPCKPGYIRRMTKAKCCWSCEWCSLGSFVYNNTCIRCKEGYQPDTSYQDCTLLPVKYLDTPWKAVVATAAGVGVVVTMFVIGVFIKFKDTPLIMAAGREVSTLLFTGMIMCYALAFVMVVPPNTTLCGIRRFGTGISFCLLYTSLLVKTNRIARIFSGTKSPSFISPKSQLFITLLIISPVLTITLLEFYFHPPKIKYTHLEKYNLLSCSNKEIAVITKLCYNVLLILLCTYYAFRTRKTPLNFNEAKFIGFCMYTTCVIWIAFLPLYFGAGGGFEGLAVCFSAVFSATTILVFIFAPKVYIVIFKPEKNLKSNSRLRSRTKSLEIAATATMDNDSDDDRKYG
ncbi:predicted protein, partial [Nematostella vectensis]